MKIVVFGANGRVGSLVIKRLLDDGHEVRAFVHSGSKFSKQDNLSIVEGDIHDTNQITAALRDREVVMSALGSWGTKDKDILSSAMRNIVPIMQKAGVQRIVSLTGAGAIAPGDQPSLIDKLNRIFIQLAASKILEDGESHIKILAASGLDWTVVRSPAMRNSKSSQYTLSKHAPAPWASVSRQAVADAMVELITSPEWSKMAPYIRGR